MENEIIKGDLVSYYDWGYTGGLISENGEMDIWDWHLYSSERILTIWGKQALVFLHSNNDKHHHIPNKISVKWIPIEFLKKIPKGK